MAIDKHTKDGQRANSICSDDVEPQTVLLRDLAYPDRPAIKAGPFGSSIKKEDYVSTGYKVYGQEQVISGNLLLGDYFLDEKKFNQLKSCAVSPGDVLLSLVGTIGKALVVPKNAPPGIINPRLLRISVDKSRINPQYLKHFVEAEPTARTLKRWSQGGTMDVLNGEIVGALPVYLPCLRMQECVVSTLSEWDTAIEKTEQLISARELHYTYELSRLISQGEHPRSHVGNFAKEVSERNRGGNDERVLSVTNSRGFVLPEDQFERRVASADLSNYKVVARGQYAYNPSRINVGSIARLDDWDMGVLSPMYVVFGLDSSRINSDYFLHWLDSHEARERIKKSAQGSVRETVSFTEFAAIAFPLPDLDRQAAIARYLNTLREEISTLGVYIEKLKEQKRGLMQKLLTGQWRVPVASTEVTA